MPGGLTPEIAVANGVQVLDHIFPDRWFREIRVEFLNMEGGGFEPLGHSAYHAHERYRCGCVCAQLNFNGNCLNDGRAAGMYDAGVAQLWAKVGEADTQMNVTDFSILHGFMSPSHTDRHRFDVDYRSWFESDEAEKWRDHPRFYHFSSAWWCALQALWEAAIHDHLRPKHPAPITPRY